MTSYLLYRTSAKNYGDFWFFFKVCLILNRCTLIVEGNGKGVFYGEDGTEE